MDVSGRKGKYRGFEIIKILTDITLERTHTLIAQVSFRGDIFLLGSLKMGSLGQSLTTLTGKNRKSF